MKADDDDGGEEDAELVSILAVTESSWEDSSCVFTFRQERTFRFSSKK